MRNRNRKLLMLGLAGGTLLSSLGGVIALAGETGFAQCEEYINVREAASEEGEVIGKLYQNGKVEILDTSADGAWYHIRSGNVDGYVAADYIATGEEADQIAQTAGYTTAEVGAYALNVRASMDESSEVVGTVYENNRYEVVDDQGDWVKVITADGTYGWVSADYVYTSTEYGAAETLEEEQARLDSQWLDYLAAQEQTSYDVSANEEAVYAQQQADSAAQTAYDSQAQADAAAQTAYDTQAQAQADYQTYLETQAQADAAAQSSQDDTQAQAQAQEAYQTYVESQSAADSAAAASQEAQAQADSDAAAAQDAAQSAAAAQEAAEADTSAQETSSQTSESVSASSTGQAIANYACQFVGNPYVYGGTSLTGGADCSGFVMSVFANFGISLPHNAAAQSGYGSAVDASSLAPGDLVFYSDGSGISHVAIYIGNGSIVHAANASSGICYGNVNYSTPVACRRLA